MHRLTARLLLTLMLVGVFAPVALAISAPPPHACCMRKMHQGSSNHTLQAAGCSSHDCCRTIAVSHFADVRPSSRLTPAVSDKLQLQPHVAFRHTSVESNLSARAPPQFSIA